jgi:hypothetical protein
MKSSELTKNEVLRLLRIYKQWMTGADPANHKPEEFKERFDGSSNNFQMIAGMFLHLYLWLLAKLGTVIGIPSLMIWASKMSIKFDYLWYEPLACGYTNACSDMGLGYLKTGKIDSAILCLKKAWRVYPCPHNTSYGLKLKLYKKLKPYPEAKEAVVEYAEMWEHFRKW